jgi:hypothetical protein
MGGGIRAWEGLVAEGIPEAGMAYFSSTARGKEMIALAWLLEDGSCKFYESLVEMMEDQEAKGLFQNLKSFQGSLIRPNSRIRSSPEIQKAM